MAFLSRIGEYESRSPQKQDGRFYYTDANKQKSSTVAPPTVVRTPSPAPSSTGSTTKHSSTNRNSPDHESLVEPPQEHSTQATQYGAPVVETAHRDAEARIYVPL